MNAFEENQLSLGKETMKVFFYFNLARLLTAPNNSIKFTCTTVSEI